MDNSFSPRREARPSNIAAASIPPLSKDNGPLTPIRSTSPRKKTMAGAAFESTAAAAEVDASDNTHFFKSSGMTVFINQFLADACKSRPVDLYAFMQQWSTEQIAMKLASQKVGRRSVETMPRGGGISLGGDDPSLTLLEEGLRSEIPIAPCRTLRQLVLRDKPDTVRFHHTGADVDVSTVLSRPAVRQVFLDAVVASSHSHVKSLCLANNGFDSITSQPFSRILQYLPGLTKLDVSKNALGAAGLINLIASFDFIPQLRVLDISEISFTEGIQAEVSAAIESLRSAFPSKISYLRSSRNNLTSLKAADFTKFCHILQSTVALQQVDLSANGLSTAQCRQVITSLRELPDLRTLVLDDNYVGVSIRALVPKRPTALEELRLAGTNLLEDGGSFVLRHLMESSCTELKCLVIPDNAITADVAALVAEVPSDSLMNLQVLDVSSNPIGDASANKLITALSAHSLQELTLSSCDLDGTHGSVEALISLVTRAEGLTKLDVGYNPKLSEVHCFVLCAAIRNAPSTVLTKLVLRGCAVPQGDGVPLEYDRVRHKLVDALGPKRGNILIF